MPHQRLVLDVGLELLPDGRFAFREVVCTEPRQSGKTTKLQSLAVWRAVTYAQAQRRPQWIAYSAQSGHDARKALMDRWLPTIEGSRMGEALRGVRRASGHEQFVWATGSRIEPIANTPASGHGKVLDLALLDEAFNDQDDRREQALRPAMVTRPDAQLWVTSTAGTEDAFYLRRKVEAGRQYVDDGLTTGSAYFEWSAPDSLDLDDIEQWPTFMPALGYTQILDVLRAEHATMPSAEFARAYGNRWTRTADSVIPAGAWAACQVSDAAPTGPLTFAIDAPPDRASAVLVVASLDESHPVLELVERRAGLAWVLDRLRELRGAHGDFREVVLHGGGPIGTLALDVEREFPGECYVAADGDMTLAAGAFYDAVCDGRVAVRPHRLLDDAVAGARQRIRGDAFTWARRSPATDLSPLVAASLALWRATTVERGALWLYR